MRLNISEYYTNLVIVFRLTFVCMFYTLCVLGHSNPDTLKEAAQDAQNLAPSELEIRQTAIQVGDDVRCVDSKL